MSAEHRLEQAFKNARQLFLSDVSHYVLFSDCHRGNGQAGDNFLKNQHLYLAALRYYYKRNFTYIELGDGDELWENPSFDSIKSAHSTSFQILADFHAAKRLFMIYGNHDMVKRSPSFQHHAEAFSICMTCREQELFPGIRFFPALIIKNQAGGPDLYLIHGHQADFLNSVLWRQARFLVRYLWSPLERVGFLDPSGGAKKNSKKERIEYTLSSFAKAHNCILISGHTHRPALNSPSSYYNTGSCVRPGYLTCIELEGFQASLIKWTIGIRRDLSLYASRELLAGPHSLLL